MKLTTLTTSTGTSAARLDGDDLVLLPFADVGELLASGEDWARRAQDGSGRRVPLADAELAVLVPHPNKIVCVGLNFRSHIEEMGRPTPEHPTLFAKYDGSLVGPTHDVHRPSVSDRLDWEAELGVVVGRRARNLTRADALSAVAGYTVVNDVTVRDWQRRTREFLSGKTFEATTPVGPFLVTTDELPEGATGLEVGCSVDGEVMQRSSTDDLLFDVAHTVAYVSTIITLLPGDLIAMGTPGGVGDGREPQVYLQPGQVLRTWVEGIGELVNRVVQD